jgi:hypothetical protein
MLRRFLAAIGVGITGAVAFAAPPYAPYSEPAANGIYNLLFCDDEEAFRPSAGEALAPWQSTLFAANPSRGAIRTLANDSTAEGRVRALAFNRLRGLGESVPKRVLLGVVVEVGLDGGLDALAAFTDGGVRYVNQSGKMAFADGGLPQTKDLVRKLLVVSQAAVEQLTPSVRPRQAPPKRGNIRVTFLVSDGLYSGEGSAGAMQSNPLAGPIVEQATQLLLAVVKLTTK